MKSSDIRDALRKRYPPAEWALAFEVARGTGASARRHLDVVAMNLWPSRGLGIEGIEIKVSRSDFLREIKDPSKAEEVAIFCDRFWIAVPPDLLTPDEIPLAWGLLEIRPKGVFTIKEAQARKPAPVDRLFMAALLRASTRPVENAELEHRFRQQAAALAEQHEKEIDARVKRQIATHRDSLVEDATAWRNLKEQLGAGDFAASKDIIDAMRAVRAVGATAAWNSARQMAESARRFADSFGEELKKLGM